MSDYTVNIDLPDHKRGDRWLGIPTIGPVIINGLQPTELLSRVRAHFKHKGSGTLFRLDSDPGATRNAPIVIVNAVTWEARVDKIQDFVSLAGEWAWDMEFYDPSNTSPLTLYKGVLTVTDDITRTA